MNVALHIPAADFIIATAEARRANLYLNPHFGEGATAVPDPNRPGAYCVRVISKGKWLQRFAKHFFNDHKEHENVE